MNKRLLKIQIVSVSFILVMLFGMIPQAVWAGNVMKEEKEIFPRPVVGYNLQSIYIFYDPTDEIMTGVAEGIREIVNFRILSVLLIPITSFSDFEYWLLDEPWIALYAFQAGLESIELSDTEISWQQFYRTLNEHRSTQHVVAMANTLSLETLLKEEDSMIHTSQEEQTDALLLILYGTHSIMEICKERSQYSDDYAKAAEDLEKIVLQIYAENFSEFFERSVEPVNIVGEMDPILAEERKKAMWDRHPGSAEPAAYKLEPNGTLREIPMDELPDDFSPFIRISSPAEVAASSFVLGEIPLLSGLQGPIGEIVDVLLGLLGNGGPQVLSIGEDAISSLKGIFDTIMPFVGIVKDFDTDSPLKSIITSLLNEFPFPQNLKKYLEPILKALFNLRGNFDSILDIVGELLEGLLPELIPPEIMTWLDTILDISGGLWDLIQDVISNGKGAFNTILSYITNNVLSGLFNKTLVATLGISAGTIADLVDKTVTVISTVVNYLSSFDFSQFIQDVGEKLLQVGFGLLTDSIGQDTIDRIMSIINMALSAVDLIDKFDQNSLIELAGQLAEEFLGLSGDTAEDIARAMMNVVKTFSEQSLPSVNDLKTQVMTAINTYAPSAAQSIKDVVRDAIALISGFFNDAFNPNDLPDLFEVIDDAIDLLPASHYTLAQTTEIKNVINNVVKPIIGLVGMVTDSDALKKMVSKTVSSFASELGNFEDLFKTLIQFLDEGDILTGAPDLQNVLETFGGIAGGIMNVIGAVRDQSFEGIMRTLLMAVGSIVGIFPSFDDVPIDAFLKLLQSFFPDAFGVDKEDLPSVQEILNEIVDMAEGLLSGIVDTDMLKEILGFILDIKGIFTDGIKWLLGKAYDWLIGQLTPLIQDLENMLNGLFSGIEDLLGVSGSLPIGLGEWSLFELDYSLGILANFHMNPDPFFEFIRSILFEGRNPFDMDGLAEFFKVIFSFFEIQPQFYASLGVDGFDSSKNPFLTMLLAYLGVELQFSGSAHFLLNLFTFRGGVFEWDEFFKVVEWGLNIKISIERTITLLDVLSGGCGGGVLNKLGQYLGLDSISIDIWFAIELDIVKKAATALEAEVSTLSLAFTIGAALNIGLDLLIVAVKFRGSLEIILTFFQDLASDAPMKILLRLVFTIKLTLRFLFWDWDGTWTWEPGGPWDLSPNKGEPEYENSGVGFDSDNDGLGDEYEATIPGLDPNNPDTDGDGANDKLEVQEMATDATDPDSDDDGLNDWEEWNLGTSPHFPDTDWDDLTDFQEERIYGTDPLTQDSDGDGLTDAYEVRTKLNITGVTPTVTEVVIGGETYNDRTDPLNPDTDGDGLVDGDEGPTGAYYGLDSLYNDTEGSGFDPNPLIFYNGYTHPLDADTDDDSYLQLYNGMIDSQALLFLKDMNDGAEVAGFWIILYDAEGEPERKHVFTNPCNPDTDGDTGITDRTPQPGAWLNSDGYELAQTPPTDPTDGDTDDDGLIDGLEGVLSQWSNHTSATDWDTDDDGLGDMQEMLLGCDPRSADTDLDMIPDGDEFYVFFTNPNVADSDFDALSDGEEVYFWHTNPLIDDSDGDTLLDGAEVLLYGSDPMDEDGDNDGLTDFEEIKVFGTDPFEYDSDNDGLSDGEEIKLYDTDPLNWDTDHDSIYEPNEFGDITWPMNDYDEVITYGTNATEADSDMDGLSDGIEIYLGGWMNYFATSPRPIIPWLDPMPLNATNHDTDGDWLADGMELLLQNVSDIVYPYISVTVVFRYNTSPVVMDSDNDTLTDYQEVLVFNCDPTVVDTDNDTIDDWWEVWVYGTSPISNDTDGDELYDWEEDLYETYPYGAWPPSNWSIGWGTENDPPQGEAPPAPIYPESLPAGYELPPSAKTLAQVPDVDGIYSTSATDRDSDDDWLPDGAEVYFYHSDPADSDTDNDGISDSFEFDTDYDGMPDAMEYENGLQTLPNGGIFYPDSDLDGLLDGEEYWVYGTHPAKMDTDGDGYGDGLEIALGMDPLTPNTREEFEIMLALQRGSTTMRILTPANGSTGYQNTPVSVVNYTFFQDAWFRYWNGSTWSENVSLVYVPASGLWQNTTVRWEPGDQHMQVFARDHLGVIHAQEVWFTVRAGDDPFWLYVIVAAIGVAVFVFLLILIDWRTKGGVRRKLRAAGGWFKRKVLRRGPPDKSSGKTKKERKSSEKKSSKKEKKDSPSEGDKGGA